MAKLLRKSKKEKVEPEFILYTRKIAEFAAKRKALNIRAYDLRGLTLIADSFVICSGSSDPHMKAIHASIAEGMKETQVLTRKTEGTYKDAWMIMDYGDIIVHIFREQARAYYDLDGLWGDAPELKLALDH